MAPAASPVVRRVVEQPWQMSERYIWLTVASPEHRRTYALHHEILCEAVASGDSDRVSREMIRHLSEAEEIALGPRDKGRTTQGGQH
jgi:DNA-binding GntR family transcriptional regulator